MSAETPSMVEEPLVPEGAAPRTCPKDGTTMDAAVGYLPSAGIWRCPTCGSVFFEPQMMKWGRAALYGRVVGLAVLGLLALLALRLLRGRPPSLS